MLAYVLDNNMVQGVVCLLEIELAREHPNKDYCCGMLDTFMKLDLLSPEDENFLKKALEQIKDF